MNVEVEGHYELNLHGVRVNISCFLSRDTLAFEHMLILRDESKVGSAKSLPVADIAVATNVSAIKRSGRQRDAIEA